MQNVEINLDDIWSMSLSDECIEDIDLFSCSEDCVGLFLKEEALKLQRVNSAHTHLFYLEEELIGFFTLFADQVTVVKSAKTKLNVQAFAVHKGHSYPAIRIHYLGVKSGYEKQGIGKFLLLMALDICREIAEVIGVNFVWLESLPSSKSFFDKHEFKKVETISTKVGKLHNMVIRMEDIRS